MDAVDRKVLECADLPPGRRQDIGVELGLSVSGFHRRLNALLDDPDAEVEYPVVVHRLRRLRDARRASRSRRRLDPRT